jgi:hypothetical protein
MNRAILWPLFGLLALAAGCSVDEQHQAISGGGSALQADLVLSELLGDSPGVQRLFVTVYNASRITYREVPWIIIHPQYPEVIMASGTIASIGPRCEVTAAVALPRLTALEMRTLTLIVAPCLSLCQASPGAVRAAGGVGTPAAARREGPLRMWSRQQRDA